MTTIIQLAKELSEQLTTSERKDEAKTKYDKAHMFCEIEKIEKERQ